MRVTAETDEEELEQAVTASTGRAAVRAGDARRNRLERNVRRQSRNWQTSVELDPEFPTAAVDAEADEDPTVIVTAREIEQPVTDYEPRAWDWLVQRGFGVHEVGHIRYSDIGDKDRRLSSYDQQDKGVAHNIWNALEDGAIESQIVQRWTNYFDVLRTLRANLFENSEQGIKDPERGGYIYTMTQAINAAILDLWAREVYGINLGLLDPLADFENEEHHFRSRNDYELFVTEALPIIEQGVEWTLSEPDPQDRNAKIFDTVDQLLPLLDDADADGRDQANGQGDSGEDEASGMPDDSRSNHDNTEPIEAGELDPDGQGQGGQGQAVDLDDIDPDDLDDVGEIEVNGKIESDGLEEAADDARQEAGIGEDVMEELREIRDTLDDEEGGNSASNDPLQSKSINVPTDVNEEYDEGRLEEARTSARGLEQILRNRLQHERRSETMRQQRRGRIDSSAIHRVRTGEDEVMMRKKEPEEKDYHCAIVLDRSGSMSGSNIQSAEQAVGMLTMALESVGVETMVVDLFNNELWLANPFRAETQQRAGEMFDGRSSGGTPLHSALEVVRARLTRESDAHQFMFVVTDGKPGDPDAFETEITRCPFPVVGVTLGSGDAGDGVYHRNVQASPGADLEDTLSNLLHEVMF